MAMMLPFLKFLSNLILSIVPVFVIGIGGMVWWCKEQEQMKLRSHLDKAREQQAKGMEEIRRSLEGQLQTLEEKIKSDLMKQQHAFEKIIELREQEQMRLTKEEQAKEMEDIFRRLLAKQLQTVEEKHRSELKKQKLIFDKLVELKDKELKRTTKEQARLMEEVFRRLLEEQLVTLEKRHREDLRKQKLCFEKSIEMRENGQKRLLQEILQKKPAARGRFTNCQK